MKKLLQWWREFNLCERPLLLSVLILSATPVAFKALLVYLAWKG